MIRLMGYSSATPHLMPEQHNVRPQWINHGEQPSQILAEEVMCQLTQSNQSNSSVNPFNQCTHYNRRDDSPSVRSLVQGDYMYDWCRANYARTQHGSPQGSKLKKFKEVQPRVSSFRDAQGK